MKKNDFKSTTDRRRFLGSLASGAAALGIATLTPVMNANAEVNHSNFSPDDPDAWFNQIKGKHRIVYDAIRTHEIMPFIWPRVFLLTNAATGTPEKDCSVVVVLRHEAIAYAFEDRIWAKYKFSDLLNVDNLGGAFQAADAATAVKTRNPFWKPKEGDFKAPGFGNVEIGINSLQASGVMFCVCNAAMTVYTNIVAMQTKTEAADVMKDWMAGLLPGIQVVPSGVWAVGRAQEHNCAYCFAG
ncbi:MAG: twin-arginine translocation signal domain-containing protein [Bacteroidia bacterium]|nr:twin-arginine translocation signal domain-containing protein [Bacteroidia bacterium]